MIAWLSVSASRADAAQVRVLQEQVASLEADVSDMRADLAHLSAQYHSLKAAKGWYFSCRSLLHVCCSFS